MLWTLGLTLLWIALALASGPLLRNPRGDAEGGIAFALIRLYLHLRHRPTITGIEHLPDTPCPGPLIVVANHASGVDPLLVQAALPFEPRWMMASHMRHPAGEALWRWARVIFVDATGKDHAGVRTALHHLRRGGVLGLFPEGGLERTPRTLRPFQPGVGVLVRRSGAPVLPVVIEEAPMAQTAWASLLRTSRPRVRILPLVRYGPKDKPADIAADIQHRFERATGWPVEPG